MTEKDKKVASETLLVDEISYKTELTDKYKNRKPWSPPDNRKITGFLPGTVTHVLVKKGEQVEENQTVVRFEAMKMINNIQTPVAGKVKEVYVKVGDKFPKGFVLVEIE
jgi:biotin carboxyl carrier protein